MQGKFIDLTGKRFGKLLVLRKSEKKTTSHGCVWVCKCDCGKETYAGTNDLNSGNKKSCGCLRTEVNHSRLADLTGKRFGRLVVVEKANGPNNRTLWHCRCDCGGETYSKPSDLTHGRTKSCGCLNLEHSVQIGKAHLINIIGKKFGKLTVVERIDDTLTYRCKCDCGNEKIVSGESLRGGHTKSCGCLKNEDPPNKIQDRETAMLKVEYGAIKKRNRYKGFKTVLSFDEFSELVHKPCYYCGKQYSKEITDESHGPKEKRRIVSGHVLRISGIDRLDSTQGYVYDNCVPCCSVCNTAKLEMNVDDFRKWIRRVYYYWAKK